MGMRPIPGGSGRSLIFNLFMLGSGVAFIISGIAAFNDNWDQAQYNALGAIVLTLWAMAWDD